MAAQARQPQPRLAAAAADGRCLNSWLLLSIDLSCSRMDENLSSWGSSQSELGRLGTTTVTLCSTLVVTWLLSSQLEPLGWQPEHMRSCPSPLTPHSKITRVLMERTRKSDILLWPIFSRYTRSLGWNIKSGTECSIETIGVQSAVSTTSLSYITTTLSCIIFTLGSYLCSPPGSQPEPMKLCMT